MIIIKIPILPPTFPGFAALVFLLRCHSPCKGDPGGQRRAGVDHFVNCWALHNLSIILILFLARSWCVDAPRNFIFRWRMSICQISVAPRGQLPDKMLQGISPSAATPLITTRGAQGAFIWLIITIIICVRLSKLTSDLIDMHLAVEFLASAQRKIVSGNRLGLIEALLCDCHIHARMQSVPPKRLWVRVRDPQIPRSPHLPVHPDPQISRSEDQVLLRLRETFTFARLDRCLRIFKHRGPSRNFCHGSRLLLISRLSGGGDRAGPGGCEYYLYRI